MRLQLIIVVALQALYIGSVKSDGIAYWGCDMCGPSVPALLKIRESAVIAHIASSELFSIILKASGGLSSFGENIDGGIGLGLPTWENVPSPRDIVVPGKHFLAVAAGRVHAAAITTDNEVFTWGRNSYGQLCNGNSGSNTVVAAPTVALRSFSTSAAPKSIAVGERFTSVLYSDGSIASCGLNEGTLGQNFGWGEVGPKLTLLSPQPSFVAVQIASGYRHLLALDDNGNIHSIGTNHFGQLGVGDISDRQNSFQSVLTGKSIGRIFASDYTSVAVSSDGLLMWAWGVNSFGRLGVGSFAPVVYEPTPVPLPSGWRLVDMASSGEASPIYLLLEQTLSGKRAIFAAGDNSRGELFLFRHAASSSFVECDLITQAIQTVPSPISKLSHGYHQITLLSSDGNGYSLVGGIRRDISRFNRGAMPTITPTQSIFDRVPLLGQNSTAAVQLLKAKDETLLLLQDGIPLVWGQWAVSSTDGSIGTGLLATPLRLAPPDGVTLVDGDVGTGYALFRSSNGRLFAGGSNQLCKGCLGLPLDISSVQLTEVEPSNFLGSQVVLVAAGSYMAAAVTGDQKIWVWGSPRNVPGVEAPIVSPMALDLSLVSEGTIWRKIWVGSDTLFVQSDAGTIFVWGSNNGLETCMESLSPLREKRSVDLPPFDIDYPPVTVAPINEDETGLPPDLAAPQESPFAPESPLKLTPWNPPGGLATTQIRLMAVSSSPIGKALPTYAVDGSPVPCLDAATSTMESAIFITTNRKIFTCGGNYWGQRGAITTAVEPTEVFGVDAATVVDIAAGSSHFTMLTSANEIFSFGRNDAGQLGRGFVNWTRTDEIGVWELDSVLRSVGELSQVERQVTTIASGSLWTLAAYTSPLAPAPVLLQPMDNHPVAPSESPVEPPSEPVDNTSKHMVLAIIFIAAIGISAGAAIWFRAQKRKAEQAAAARADMIPLEDLSSHSARPDAPTPLESYVI